MAGDNMTLGRFRLEGIPPAPRGIPQVEVTFDIDANGILNVTAMDKATGKEQKVTITASTNLSQNEIDRMVHEAQEHKADDGKRKEHIELRNQADHLVYQAEKTLNELGEKVDGSMRADMEGKISDVKSALESDDSNRLQITTQALQQALSQMGQAAYQGAQPGDGSAGPNGQGEEGPDDETVVEGEFTEA
jgi:molecular chaperone DnaK